jgi:hypothetical protein
MNPHEKHQYFYEKYLRNEMPDHERLAFEEKLSADESFKQSFYHYKNNRKEFLENLIIEDETEAKKRWSLNSWIYLLISLTGIALAINYKVFQREEQPHTISAPAAPYWNIFKRIPFISKRNDSSARMELRDKNAKVASDSPIYSTSKENDTVKDNDETGETDAFIPEEVGVASDVMELDSFIVAYEKRFFELRYKTIRDQTDSILVDSMMDMLAAKSAGRSTLQSKPVMVYVEFWRSPVNFRGYKFNGKKLIVYGIPPPYEIFLLRDGEEVILRSNRNELILTKDNNFHKF